MPDLPTATLAELLRTTGAAERFSRSIDEAKAKMLAEFEPPPRAVPMPPLQWFFPWPRSMPDAR